MRKIIVLLVFLLDSRALFRYVTNLDGPVFKDHIFLMPWIGSDACSINPTPSCTTRNDPLLGPPEQHTNVC